MWLCFLRLLCKPKSCFVGCETKSSNVAVVVVVCDFLWDEVQSRSNEETVDIEEAAAAPVSATRIRF